MRVTLNAITRQYNSSLNKVLSNLNQANQRVISQRKFDRASEDPHSAVKAYQLRREFRNNEDSLTALRDAQGMFDSMENSIMSVSQSATDAYIDVLGIINGTNNESNRSIVAEKLREMQKSMVLDLNVVYGGRYLFGGTSTKGLPLELSDDGKTLTYRGLDVSDPNNQAQLKELVGDKMYVDLGFGVKLDAGGEVMENSAFNTALPAVGFLGYGTDGDGTTNNIILMLGELADALESPDFSIENISPLMKKFEGQRDNLLVAVTKFGTSSRFLEYTENRLLDNQLNYNERILDVEYIDLEEAIMDFQMQQYTYQAALKMGMSVLSASFLDYMR